MLDQTPNTTNDQHNAVIQKWFLLFFLLFSFPLYLFSHWTTNLTQYKFHEILSQRDNCWNSSTQFHKYSQYSLSSLCHSRPNHKICLISSVDNWENAFPTFIFLFGVISWLAVLQKCSNLWNLNKNKIRKNFLYKNSCPDAPILSTHRKRTRAKRILSLL